MKRAYREHALNRLYADLQSGDFDLREYAMFQLALLLRRANDEAPSSNTIDDNSEHLSRDLLRIRLSPADQAQIAAHLLRLNSRYADSQATAFWVLGEVSADIGCTALLATIRGCAAQLTDEAAYQVCRALRRWLEAGKLEADQAKELLADHDPLPWLTRWSHSADRRLAQSAIAVISAARELAD